MNISRRDFLGGIAAASTLAAAPGCCTKFGKCCRPGKVAVQLYSVRNYIGGNVKIKAAGGIKDLTTAVKMIKRGADRIGSSSSVAIMQEAIAMQNNA